MQANPRLWLAGIFACGLYFLPSAYDSLFAAEINWGNPESARPPAVLQNMGDPTIIKEGSWFY
ncbi:hypothetical protein EBT11_09280, partial [bacterium]|nr:hypothetical protein [bacterium]